MEQNTPALDEFKDNWEQCIQKLLISLSVIIKQDLKEVIEKETSFTIQR